MVNNVKAGERVISHQAKEQTKASIQLQVAAAPKQVKIKMSKPASTKTAVGVQERCRTKDGRDLYESSSASDVVKRVGTPALQPIAAALPPIAAAAPRLVTATPPTAVAVPPIASATMLARKGHTTNACSRRCATLSHSSAVHSRRATFGGNCAISDGS